MTMAANQSNDVFNPFSSMGFMANPLETPEDLDEFDPFHIGEPSPQSKKPVSPQRSPEQKVSAGVTTVTGRASTALPPRLDVKLKLHEEISSTADKSDENEGSSDIFVEGTIMV